MLQPRRDRCKQTRGVPSPCRVGDFMHVRLPGSLFSRTSALCTVRPKFGSKQQRGRSQWGSEVRERRSNLASRTPYNGVRSAKRSVWRGQGAAWKSGEVKELRGSLELGACSWWRSSRRTEETRAGSTAKPAVPRGATCSCAGRGESSPASARRSEVIGLQDSPSIAEGRTVSYKEHQL